MDGSPEGTPLSIQEDGVVGDAVKAQSFDVVGVNFRIPQRFTKSSPESLIPKLRVVLHPSRARVVIWIVSQG
jgi:hypothetical protein